MLETRGVRGEVATRGERSCQAVARLRSTGVNLGEFLGLELDVDLSDRAGVNA